MSYVNPVLAPPVLPQAPTAADVKGSRNIGRSRGDNVVFSYACECRGCDEAGTLTVKKHGAGTVSCPANCGAVYYPWRNPLSRRWELKAVVMPGGLA